MVGSLNSEFGVEPERFSWTVCPLLLMLFDVVSSWVVLVSFALRWDGLLSAPFCRSVGLQPFPYQLFGPQLGNDHPL